MAREDVLATAAHSAGPTLGWYTECVDEILSRLQSQTSARIAVLDIPMIGEALTSDLNRRVDSYNQALRRVAAAHAADCLPLHDRLASLLPSPHSPPPYRGRFGPMIKASLSHSILRRSWDQISASNGLVVLIDHVHLNDRAAVLTADLVADFIRAAGQPTR
jgi:acyl-CoA thioesterase I